MVKMGDVSPYCLLAGDPGRVERVSSMFLKNAREVSRYRGFAVYTGEYEGITVSAVSTGIGTPSACIVAEELAKVGAKVLIRIGTTGSLQEHIDLGDLVIATAATRTDGATKAYVPIELPAVASFDVTSALVKAADGLGVKYYLGPVFTSDAFYAEDPEFARKWGGMGVLSVEMECSGIFTVASLRGLKAGAILAVDGNLVKGKKKGEFEVGEEAGELHPLVKKAIDDEIKVALEAIKLLKKGA
jgi:uridine phosphorylase